MPTLITAVLFAIKCAACEPVPMAAFFTPAGPSICQATARHLNAEADGKYPQFYCDPE